MSFLLAIPYDGVVMPALAGLFVLALQGIIFFQDFDSRWRAASHALTPIPLLLGIAMFASGVRATADAVVWGVPPVTGSIGRGFLSGFEECFPGLMFSAGITGVLLATGGCLHLPLRRGGLRQLAIIWGFSLMMILMDISSAGFIQHKIWMAIHVTSGPTPAGSPGIITEAYQFFAGHITPWFIPIWLMVAALVSMRLNPANRLRIAYGVFAFSIVLTVISCLMLVKMVVVTGAARPAIAGRSWVDLLSVRSW